MELIRRYHTLNTRLRALEEAYDELLEEAFSHELMFEIEELVEELNSIVFERKAVRSALLVHN